MREMSRLAIAIWLLAATANAGEASFAAIGLARDAAALATAHAESLFRTAPAGPIEPCVRGDAVPWFVADLPKDMHAFRQISPTTAVETFIRDDGANLTIVQGGCETYAASFRFVAPRRAGGGEAVEEVIIALRELQWLETDAAFDFALAERELSRRRDLGSLLASREEIAVPGDGEDFLQTRIVLERAGPVPGEAAVFVEFRMMKGPL